jgi:hypothetical protein
MTTYIPNYISIYLSIYLSIYYLSIYLSLPTDLWCTQHGVTPGAVSGLTAEVGGKHTSRPLTTTTPAVTTDIASEQVRCG